MPRASGGVRRSVIPQHAHTARFHAWNQSKDVCELIDKPSWSHIPLRWSQDIMCLETSVTPSPSGRTNQHRRQAAGKFVKCLAKTRADLDKSYVFVVKIKRSEYS